jgi:hypothetical protein
MTPPLKDTCSFSLAPFSFSHRVRIPHLAPITRRRRLTTSNASSLIAPCLLPISRMLLQAAVLPNVATVGSILVLCYHTASRHRSHAQRAGGRVDRLVIRLPTAELVLCVIEDLASRFGVLKCWVRVTGHNGGIIEEVDNTPGLLG